MNATTRLRRAGALVLAAALVLLLAAPAAAAPDRSPDPEPGPLQVIQAWLASWLPELGPTIEALGQDPGGATSRSGLVEYPERGAGLDPAG